MSKVESTKQVTPPELRNSTGKGGFGDHPENRSDGRWSKDNSFSYWMNYFKSLDTKTFLSWEKDNPKHSMAASLAYARVFKSRNDLREFEVVANRTEGLPKASMELSGPGGGPIETMEVDTINRIYGSNTDRKTSDPSETGGSTSGATPDVQGK